MNYFMPSLKLATKTRTGAKVERRFHTPSAPSDRLPAHTGVPAQVKEQLRRPQAKLDPVALLTSIRSAQAELLDLEGQQRGAEVERATTND